MAISNASNQIVKVNLVPGIIPSVLYLSQYDTGAGRPVTFSVYDGSQAFTIPSGVSIAFEGTKPDGNGFSFTCSKSGSSVLLTNYTNQMTALPGKIMCQLVFTGTSGGRVGSLPVLMVVSPAGINGDTVISDSDIEAIVAAQNRYAVLNAKLDTAISAVTQDSEVQDIRISADGRLFTTAGESVRQQFKEITGSTKNLYSGADQVVQLGIGGTYSRTKGITLPTSIQVGSYTISYKYVNNGVSLVGFTPFSEKGGTQTGGCSSYPSEAQGEASASFKLSGETSYIYIYIYIPSSTADGSYIEIYDIQIEAGSEATEYVYPTTAVDITARNEINTAQENITIINDDLNQLSNTVETLENLPDSVDSLYDIVVIKLSTTNRFIESDSIVSKSSVLVDSVGSTSIIHTGKNLVDIPNLYLVKSTNRTYTYNLPIKIPSGSFSFSFVATGDVTYLQVEIHNSNNTLIKGLYNISVGKNILNFTSNEDIFRIFFYIKVSAPDSSNVTISDIQLESGLTNTDYEEYRSEIIQSNSGKFIGFEGIDCFWGDVGQITIQAYISKINAIKYISKEGTDGLVDTYAIHFTNGTQYRYHVSNGSVDNETIKELLDDLLEEHPEWTSTVLDHSIDEEKISTEFLPYIKKEYVTPEMFGAVGDGLTDDTTPVQQAIDYAALHNCKILFKTKTVYLVSKINITDNIQSIDFCDCTLKASEAGTVLEVTATTNTPHGYIKNLTIDMNNIALIGIGFTICWRKTFEEIQINNAPSGGIGIYVYGNDTTQKSGGNLFQNIRGRTNNPGAAIIDIAAGDNTFSNIDWINYTKGIIVRKWSVLSNIHGFIGGDDFYPNSAFMMCYGRFMGTNLYPDTQEMCFYMDGNANGSILTNVFTTFNSEAVSSELLEERPPYYFKCPDNSPMNYLDRTIINGLCYDGTGKYDGEHFINISPYSMKLTGVTGHQRTTIPEPNFSVGKNDDFTYENGGIQKDGIWSERIIINNVGTLAKDTVIGKNGYGGLTFIPGIYIAFYESNGEILQTFVIVSNDTEKTIRTGENLNDCNAIYVNLPNITTKYSY